MIAGGPREGVVYFQSKGFPEFRFLSNFHVHRLYANGRWYNSVEHYYQCCKTVDEQEFQYVYSSRTPAEARRRGHQIKVARDWENGKLLAMENAVRIKFSDPELATFLLATDGHELVEYAPWGDTFWGVGKDYEGQNHLGKILMKVREEIKR